MQGGAATAPLPMTTRNRALQNQAYLTASVVEMGQNESMEPAIGVVIIDDSAQWVRRLEGTVAELEGLSVVGSAATPSGALDLVSSLEPPIMILDMSLSGGSGLEVLKALAGQRGNTRVAVCLGLEARHFFDKAFQIEEFQSALRSLMEELCNRN